MEKFEENAKRADIAFALLTPDDFATEEGSGRARQNVIFELGFFVGKLGRKNVCALYEDGVEIPSDFQGVAADSEIEFCLATVVYCNVWNHYCS